MTNKPYSLTRRLLLAVLLVELGSALLLVASAAAYEGVSRFRTFDIMLRGRADSLFGAVQDAEDEKDNVMLDGSERSLPKDDVYAVRDEQGRLLGHSANWPGPYPEFDSTQHFLRLALGRRHYRILRIEGLRVVDPGEKSGGTRHQIVVLYGARTHPVWKGVLHAILFYGLLSLLLLALSAWIMARLLRRGLAPLEELAGQAARVSVDAWHFEPSNDVRDVRELAPLATALETVLAGLERSFAQQRQFVGDAAHELKTSVAVIKSSLQVMLMIDRRPEDYRAGLHRAAFDCERMEQLVASMLTLARVEAGTPEPQASEPVDLTDIVREVAEHLRSTAELGNLGLVLHAPHQVWLHGDRERIRLLCSNLVQNALQHSRAGQQVSVTVATLLQQVDLIVEDQGEGIPAEALPHVFERFYRADASRSRRTGGTGLGLAIAKAVADSMNGHIQITSQPGRGTSVRVSLPLSSEKLKLASA